MLRIRRNCTEWIDCSKNIIKLCLHLSKRGYPNDIIKDSVKRVAKLRQSDALKSQLIDGSNCKFFCITEYNPSIPDIQSFIRNMWSLFDRSSSTRILLEHKIIFGHRKPKCIQEWLTRANVNPILTKSIRLKCHKFPKCIHCPKLIKNGKIISTSTQQTYSIPRKISCNSTNVIYCIECTSCGLQYVGQTKNKFLT